MRASYVFVCSAAVAIAAPVAMAVFGIGAPAAPQFGFFNGQSSTISDPAGDASAVLQRQNVSATPEVRGYHDLLSASVSRQGESFALELDVAGDPNLNEKYETVYMWHLVSAEDRYYVVMFVNFAPGFHDSQGWHYAIFDMTENQYVVPLTAIGQMPADRVAYSIDADLIGNPASFRYWVSVYSRVEPTFDDWPEYLMDYAP